MAAAVSHQSPNMNAKSSMPSPHVKKAQIKTEDNHPPVPSIAHPDEKKPIDGSKDTSAPTTNAPLAPPPRPNQNNDSKNGDYFAHPGAGQSQQGQPQEGKEYFSREPNPFENAFGAPSDTPGKTQLPGVTSLTSPAPLGLGASTPGWPGSLRSGPLSPAMLTGPTNNDYFSNDHHFAGSFPTPNESSLRTGLTPGGGGSMFPQPSPNSQAIFNSLQSGGATPGTLDFHRTAMHARAASQINTNSNNNNNANNNNNQNEFVMPQNNVTSQPQDPNIQPNLDGKGFNNGQQQQQRDQFESHDANDAANGLFMLAQARSNNQSQQPQQYPAPSQQSQMNYMPNAPHIQSQLNQQDRGGKNSIASNMSGSTHNGEDRYSESSNEQSKPSGRAGKGKKGSSAKSTNRTRKAEETPSKGPNKRQKGNSGAMTMSHKDDMDDDDDEEIEEDDENAVNEHGRKLTDEEKRKNFLERNRIAALKCRQRKKQWLANLQQKVEIFSTENDALAATVTQLREEIVGLKTLLLAHKDCPVSQAQGISGMAMQNIAGEPQQYSNPYGMGMPQGMQQHGMQQANMQRR